MSVSNASTSLLICAKAAFFSSSANVPTVGFTSRDASVGLKADSRFLQSVNNPLTVMPMTIRDTTVIVILRRRDESRFPGGLTGDVLAIGAFVVGALETVGLVAGILTIGSLAVGLTMAGAAGALAACAWMGILGDAPGVAPAGRGLSASRTSRICSTTYSIPRSVETASRSARIGECRATSSMVRSCQIGSRTLVRFTVSRARNPLSSRWGHSFAKKRGLRMTTPNLADARPRSMTPRRLSPRRRTYSSYQTTSPLLRRDSAKGRAMSLSSLACEMKISARLSSGVKGGAFKGRLTPFDS